MLYQLAAGRPADGHQCAVDAGRMQQRTCILSKQVLSVLIRMTMHAKAAGVSGLAG